MAGYLAGIVFTQDGYLLLPDHKAQGGHDNRKPLVLTSVEQLWLKFHPHCQEIHFVPTSVSTDAGLPVDFATQTANTTSPTPTVKPSDLIRFRDMSNNILPILEDIDKMKDQQRFLTRQEREERDGRIQDAQANPSRRKVAALEREQNAHKKQAAGVGNRSNHDGDMNVDRDQDDVTDYADATLRVVKTLNSIRLIVPMLVQLLNHESQNDASLIIGKESIAVSSNRKSRDRRWMLGEYVFDIGSSKNFRHLQATLRHTVRPLATPEEIDDLMDGHVNWADVLGRWYSKSQSPMPNLLELNDEQVVNAKAHDAALQQYLHEGATSDNDLRDEFANAVQRLKQKLDAVLQERFRGCRLEVYGSCLSNLSIGVSSDVDISIHIPELKNAKDRFEQGTMTAQKYEGVLKRHVYAVRGKLQQCKKDFFDTEAVARARVPVVKGTYRFAENPYTNDGSLHFDICFFNDIAVRNSMLIRDYTEVCQTSKDLMMAVKKWAKEKKICSSADQKLSSYAWMILVIHYLQQIGVLPNLQCAELMKKAGFEPDPSHAVNALNTAFLPWEQVKQMNVWDQPAELDDVPVSVLLHGFFRYMSMHFPSRLLAASIQTSSSIPRPLSPKCSLSFLCIEDPFETFDSHCPHDLGSPANSNAQSEIMTLLAEAECHVRTVLLGGEGELWNKPKVNDHSTYLVDNCDNNVPSVVPEHDRAKMAALSETGNEITTARERSDDKNLGDNGDDEADSKGKNNRLGKQERRRRNNRVKDNVTSTRTNVDEQHKITASSTNGNYGTKPSSEGNLNRSVKSRRSKVHKELVGKSALMAPAARKDDTTKKDIILNQTGKSERIKADKDLAEKGVETAPAATNGETAKLKLEMKHQEPVNEHNETNPSGNRGGGITAKAEGKAKRYRRRAPKGQEGITKGSK